MTFEPWDSLTDVQLSHPGSREWWAQPGKRSEKCNDPRPTISACEVQVLCAVMSCTWTQPESSVRMCAVGKCVYRHVFSLFWSSELWRRTSAWSAAWSSAGGSMLRSRKRSVWCSDPENLPTSAPNTRVSFTCCQSEWWGFQSAARARRPWTSMYINVSQPHEGLQLAAAGAPSAGYCRCDQGVTWGWKCL